MVYISQLINPNPSFSVLTPSRVSLSLSSGGMAHHAQELGRGGAQEGAALGGRGRRDGAWGGRHGGGAREGAARRQRTGGVARRGGAVADR